MIIALLMLLTLIAAGIWYIRQKGGADNSPTRTTKAAGSPPSAIEIRCGKQACARARAMVGKKLLARDVPALPLTGCSMQNCQCAYRKIGDRRQERRRSIDDGIEPLIYDGAELRKRGERRAS